MATRHDDEVTTWIPARQGEVVSISRVRAERAEQRAAVLAGRAQTSEARLLAAERSRDAYRADMDMWARECGRLRRREWLVVGLAALVAALSAAVWALALGWRGAALAVGLAVFALAWGLAKRWEK